MCMYTPTSSRTSNKRNILTNFKLNLQKYLYPTGTYVGLTVLHNSLYVCIQYIPNYSKASLWLKLLAIMNTNLHWFKKKILQIHSEEGNQ